jgi:hypothetical protein
MCLLGGLAMLRSVAAIAATLLGVAFFFAIIGVFGLTVSIAALASFVVLALLIFRCRQVEGTQR